LREKLSDHSVEGRFFNPAVQAKNLFDPLSCSSGVERFIENKLIDVRFKSVRYAGPIAASRFFFVNASSETQMAYGLFIVSVLCNDTTVADIRGSRLQGSRSGAHDTNHAAHSGVESHNESELR
jgi:hypothetical protein